MEHNYRNAGRKPGSKNKEYKLNKAVHYTLSIYPDELEILKNKASESGKNLSRYIIESLIN